jgi:UDP-N-acetylglucosamine 2-epimerase
MTCHRRENIETTQSLLSIFRLAESVGEKVVFAAGYRTQRQIKDLGIELPRNVNMIDPIGYVELMELAVESVGILTDSGTLVEEAAVLKVPSVQMRTSTERPQVYDTGGCVKFDPLITHSDEDLAKLVLEVRNRRQTADAHNLGDGKASEIIVRDLLQRLKDNTFKGHTESDRRRPISRNYGAGIGNRGQV